MSEPHNNLSADKRAIAEDLAAQLSEEGVVRVDEPLARRTTLRVGGPADFFVEPASEGDLSSTLKWCGQRGMRFFVIGRGSNLLVKDRGYRGVVISLAHAVFARIEREGERLRCGAGARLKAIAFEARHQALGGLEFLEGIPGSLGGALRMNAGAMGGATFDVVESVRVMDFCGATRELPRDGMELGYRSCPALKDRIALGAVLRGHPAPQEEIERKLSEFSRKRWASQPAAPSAGCMFKNPAAIPAGKLIDELGLKGERVGGARVSMEHGNFLVNEGNATASDVLKLIELIRGRARAERGIELEPEVVIVGE